MGHGLALDKAAWASPWRTRSIRDKGILSLGLLLSAVTLAPMPSGMAVALASAVLLLGPIRVAPAALWRIGWMPLLSILVGVATVAVSPTWAGGPGLVVTSAGLTTAGRLAIRAVAATLAMFTLACSTPVVDLFDALRRARVPDALIEIASLVYRLTEGLLASVAAIRDAQEARLGYATRSAAMRSASMGVAVLFLRSWDRARRLEAGLAGRGYDDGLRTLGAERVRSGRFLACSVALLATVAGLSILSVVFR